ncbi:ATP synthase F1 subunit epsilon [Mycoplasmopsis ciconiae]|uniref:ATP synthase epsilon chain n=1 Tax=Mycoplasmopsis ciconiae TaxID=561067 RepID=A0ABU7MKY2_9BACT|nr:ATP synthase F1 subunit epsilon [Mycoplasmopsis ciconiae]
MKKTVHLTILTPDAKFYEGDVSLVTLKAGNGYIGLQPNRAPFFSNIDVGFLTIENEKSPNYAKFTIGGGLVYADSSTINIITDDIIDFKNIDIARAKRDKEWAEKELLKYDNDKNVLLELKLKKALSRIDAYNSIHNK